MKERPILFSGAMVRALLAGSKTQTRRVCKPATTLSAVVEVPDPMERGQVYNGSHFGDEDGAVQFACPYGGIGDRLWVRETFRGCRAYEVQGYPPKDWGNKPIWFEADGAPPGDAKAWALRARPSIHMPRWASRITLEVTAVRVERLQDISEDDAIAEGCTLNHNGYYWGGPHAVSGLKQLATAKGAYQDLWESINGPGSWDANPWVWVVEFRRLA